MKKLDYIDALRGLAVLGVVIVHVNLYGRSNANHPLLDKLAWEGGKGVQLFFMASAMTLFISMGKGHAGEKSPIRNFFIRRFFRIAPMYYLGIAYYLLQEGFGPRYWLGDGAGVSIANILSNLTFLHGLNPYWITSVVPGGWSIAVEMMFYMVLPFLFSKVKNLNQAFNLFLITLVMRFLLELFFNSHMLISHAGLWEAYLFFYFPGQLPIFALGIMMYFIIIDQQKLKDVSAWSLLILGLLLITQLVAGMQGLFSRHILFGAGFLALGIALSKYRFPLIVNPVIKYIGKISFSMYLVHFGVLYWLTKLNFIDYVSNDFLNFGLRYLLVTAITILLSSITYRFVEVPFQGLGKNLIARLENG